MNKNTLNGHHMVTLILAKDQLSHHVSNTVCQSQATQEALPLPLNIVFGCCGSKKENCLWCWYSDRSSSKHNPGDEMRNGTLIPSRTWSLAYQPGFEQRSQSGKHSIFLFPLEAEKHAFKLIFFQFHDWDSKSFPPAPNPQPTPATSSTKTSTLNEPSPTEREHLQDIISLSYPLCLSPSTIIPPSLTHAFAVTMLWGYQGNPINSPSVKFEPSNAHFLVSHFRTHVLERHGMVWIFVWPQLRGKQTGHMCVLVCMCSYCSTYSSVCEQAVSDTCRSLRQALWG